LVGVAGAVSHYSLGPSEASLQATLVMFGPRVTLHGRGISVFVHGLGGFVHQNANGATYPPPGYYAGSYAIGGGFEVPVFRGLKFRVAGDYLGNSKVPSGADYSPGPSHQRIGAGVAYHF
jgi:hypothetical protein